MSTRDKSYNGQFLTPSYNGGPLISAGPSWFVSSNGENRTPGQPTWYPHHYNCLAGNQSIGVYRKVVVSGGWTPPWTDYQLISQTTAKSLPSNHMAKLYGRLADMYNDGTFNAPVFAGELGEAVDMVADNVRRLANAGLALKRGNLRAAAGHLGVSANSRRYPSRPGKKGNLAVPADEIGGRWLELRYGWTPLIGDIYNLSETIVNRDQPRKVRLRTSVSSDEFVPKSGSSLYAPSGTGRVGVQLIAYIDELMPTLADRLGLHDPASIAWELTPFSFVADWLLPIGDYLKARHFASNTSGVFCRTDRTKYVTRISSRNTRADGLKDFDYLDPWYLSWTRQINLGRTVTTSLPSLPLPKFRNPWNGTSNRLKDALALANSVFGKNRARYY